MTEPRESHAHIGTAIILKDPPWVNLTLNEHITIFPTATKSNQNLTITFLRRIFICFNQALFFN